MVFETTEAQIRLESKISNAIVETYGFEVPVIVISAEALLKIGTMNPYLKEEDVMRLHVTFLKEKPSTDLVAKTNKKEFLPDVFTIKDRFVFLNIDAKYHKSKLSNNFFEKQLKVIATTRNWKTISKLIEMCQSL